jgi:hypothetical protein
MVGDETMKHVVMFSGGVGSWAAAKRVEAEHGTADLVLLFADPLAEHRETYRCLFDGAANVFGLPRPIVPRAIVSALPDLSNDSAVLAQRKTMLGWAFASMATIAPQLVRLCDGRTPWELFRDVRFVGNSRVDPCSRVLKRERQDAWRNETCKPEDTTCYVGLDWSEAHRFIGTPTKRGLRDRMADLGWTYKAPMCDAPFLSKAQMLDWQRIEGIEPSQTYADGFPHDNCSGTCCKAGHANWRLLLRKRPNLYAYAEQQEQLAIAALGPDACMLNDRRGGERRPMSLATFRERIESKPDPTPLSAEDLDEEWGGCGCAIDEPEAA